MKHHLYAITAYLNFDGADQATGRFAFRSRIRRIDRRATVAATSEQKKQQNRRTRFDHD
jgi:hypothetical protein